MNDDERTNRSLVHFLYFCGAITLVALGMVIGNYFPAETDDYQGPADWTVASCEMWADTSDPVLPAYTRTDVCAVRTATGAWYMSSPTNPSPLDAPVTR